MDILEQSFTLQSLFTNYPTVSFWICYVLGIGLIGVPTAKILKKRQQAGSMFLACHICSSASSARGEPYTCQSCSIWYGGAAILYPLTFGISALVAVLIGIATVVGAFGKKL